MSKYPVKIGGEAYQQAIRQLLLGERNSQKASDYGNGMHACGCIGP